MGLAGAIGIRMMRRIAPQGGLPTGVPTLAKTVKGATA